VEEVLSVTTAKEVAASAGGREMEETSLADVAVTRD
jgi:hypothetical protein